MATFRTFEEIAAWKKARELTHDIYRLTGSGAFAKEYALRDQIRRASISVMSNIAEGFERDGKREFVQFLSIAKGSAGELRAQLCIAFDQGYIDTETFGRLDGISREIGKMIGSLIDYLRRSSIKGTKYK